MSSFLAQIRAMKIALNTLESEYISKYPEEAIVKTKDLDDKSKAKSKKESKKESTKERKINAFLAMVVV